MQFAIKLKFFTLTYRGIVSHTMDNSNKFKCKRFIQLLNAISERRKAKY